MENLHFILLLFLQLWREGLRKYENYGTNFWHLFRTFSQLFKKNEATECSSDNFPCILDMENCPSIILMDNWSTFAEEGPYAKISEL